MYRVFFINISDFLSSLCLLVLHLFESIKEFSSGIFFFSKLFIFALGVLIFVFLTTSLSTTSLTFFKFTGITSDLPISKSSTFVFKWLKLVGTLTKLLMSSLLTSAFKKVKNFLQLNQMYQRL